MNTVYPDKKEIEFRSTNYSDILCVWRNEMTCTICTTSLKNEIIVKKMIFVHKTFLTLCCYNCFYKLCEGNEYCCILCQSNDGLSCCSLCGLNVCYRCAKNHKLPKNDKNCLIKCFNCAPQTLWSNRAKTVIALKVFSSQLHLSRGLIVNETEDEQLVRKYLINEAKTSSKNINNIKDIICLEHLSDSFKLVINETLLELENQFNDSTESHEEHLNNFIHTCEKVLENAFSTLNNVKKIYNIKTHFNPMVLSIIKSILKPVEENIDNTVNKTPSRKKSITNISVENEHAIQENDTNASLQENENQDKSRDVFVVIERLDDVLLEKVLKKKKNQSCDDNSDEDRDPCHPLNMFDENLSSEEDEKSFQIKTSTKIIQNKKENFSKSSCVLICENSDDKEYDKLTRLTSIERSKVVKNIENNSNESDCSVNSVNSNIRKSSFDDKDSLKRQNSQTNDSQKLMEDIINDIQDTEIGDESLNSQEEHMLSPIRNIFSEVKNTIEIPKIDEEMSDNESDSCILDVVESCINEFKRHGVEHYLNKERNKNIESKLNVSPENSEIYDKDESSSSSTNEELNKIRKFKPCSPINISLTTESDSNTDTEKINNGRKRNNGYSNDSDSSSKYFKPSPKKRRRIKKNSFSHSSSEFNSDKSSRSNSPIILRIKPKNNLIKDNDSDTSEDSTSDSNTTLFLSQKKKRKEIRSIIKSNDLSESTKNALIEEDLRKKRIEERQKLYNETFEMPLLTGTCDNLILDFDPVNKKELVTVHPNFVKCLKPHQIKGVKFLWQSVFETLDHAKNHPGSGCIIAHCMGLGKTLQIITLIHTLFSHSEIGIKTVLIIAPHCTLENWIREFDKWLQDIPGRSIPIINLADSKTYISRANAIQEWTNGYGVLIASYNMFRSIVNFKDVEKKYPSIISGLLDPGPDLIICDEGHLLKNHESLLSKSFKKLKTRRRIVLTGTPMQNNLKEYYCMVEFVFPNILGTMKEFTNRFINPITNGQYSDSTLHDVKLMKRRSHVLHKILKGIIQRFDYSVLTPFLPPKHEYVIYLKLSELQIKLYKHFLDNHRQPDLFTNFFILKLIWTHPKLLSIHVMNVKKKIEKQKYKELEAQFLNDESDKSDLEEGIEENAGEKLLSVLELNKTRGTDLDPNWWKPLIPKRSMLNSVHPFSKFIMMFAILKECEEIGDKVLLFSESLYTLDLIQEFLENTEDIHDQAGPYGNSWIQGEDFFRVDGNVSVKIREECCQKFNDISNTRLRLLLLSTRAFNLGINLVAANRVIIFDVTWNPSLNVQSIFRVFRFGQTKPCYVYRLVSEGTMEEKMYNRQISKLSMAFRVVDEHQIDRHFNAKDQDELYEFDPCTSKPKTQIFPKDRLMQNLIYGYKDIIINVLEHDSLLQNNEAEELDQNDQEAAWAEYENERQGINLQFQNSFGFQNSVFDIQGQNQHYQNRTQVRATHIQTSREDEQLFNSLKSLFPQASLIQLNEMLNQVKSAKNNFQ
ncbi:transcriptional regulator ATRX homolog isoform X2 [Daktulosphaira vitifoliae]|uniref:transcriptional regulator ATRX homolog isoform X2 n=1 Tax=Daktulosphaira vitifoliae TaxID=58002 RepID=UPI0021AA287F|nr:transcriptional regulator ATRX homolog isoform X2 [Daktulosphaira vitifoliae]